MGLNAKRLNGGYSGISGGVYPFAKSYLMSERFKRSLVCTSSPLHSLRPRWTAFLTILNDESSEIIRKGVFQEPTNRFSLAM